MSLLLILSAVLCAEGSNGVVRKYWVHSNNWNNPKNWDVSPDPCDPVILSDRGYDYSVLVTSRAHLNSLEFPSTGELMFGDRASITFSLSGLGPGQCSSPVSNTYTARQYSWGDPNNWYSPSRDPIFSTADSDRIPCWTDEVVFNESSVFNVLLDKSVEVGALKIGAEDLDTEDVRAYTLGSGRSQLQFINLAQLIVTGRTVCTNHQGCLCGNQLDCSSECPRRDCAKPIKSKGMCCHYCGAEVRFRPPAGFYLEKFKKSLGNFLKDKQLINDDISITVSLQEYELSTLNVLITVSDSITDGIEGAGYESSRIASKIHDYILDYDIVRASDLFILQSHLPYKSEATESLKPNQTVAGGIQSWVLYVVLSVSFVLLIIIVVLLFKCSRRYRDNGNNQPHVRLDHGVLPRTLDRRFKPCVPALDQDIPTYEEVLMEDMLTRGIAPDQPRSQDTVLRSAPRRPGYAEIPTSDICDRARV